MWTNVDAGFVQVCLTFSGSWFKLSERGNEDFPLKECLHKVVMHSAELRITLGLKLHLVDSSLRHLCKKDMLQCDKHHLASDLGEVDGCFNNNKCQYHSTVANTPRHTPKS